MKKVMISVDLEDNEILQKAVMDAVKGSAKQIAREEFDRTLREEVERITEKHVKDLKASSWSRCSKLEEMAKNKVDQTVQEAIEEIKIPKEAFRERLEEIISDLESDIDSMVAERLGKMQLEDYVEEKVRQEVKAKVPKTLLDIILDGIQARGNQK